MFYSVNSSERSYISREQSAIVQRALKSIIQAKMHQRDVS